MGYLDILNKLQIKSNFRYSITKKFLNILFRRVDHFIFLGEGEKKLFDEKFNFLINRSIYIPFGIDEVFWDTPTNKRLKKDYILFIGNDKNRDFELLKKIIKSNVNYKFKVLTNKSNFLDYKKYKNLTLIDSDWKKFLISDVEILNIYSQAKLVIIPLKDVYQPSGQSVCLQAMSCSKCVLISETKGFWDKRIKHREHLIKIKDNKLSNWNKEISKYFYLDNIEIENNAKKIISQFFTSRIFAEKIANIIDIYEQ